MNFHDNRFNEGYLLQINLEKILREKEEKDIIEDLIARPELIELKPEKPPEPIADFFESKISHFKDKIDQLNKEISTRFQMKDKFKKEID